MQRAFRAGDDFDIHVLSDAGAHHDDVRIEVIGRESGSGVLTVNGVIAMRIVALFDAVSAGVSLASFNCFGMVHYIVGNDAVPQHYQDMTCRGAIVEGTTLPEHPGHGIVQIGGRYLTYPHDAAEAQSTDGLLHAALILGGQGDDPVLLEKNRRGALRMQRWSKTLKQYSEPSAGREYILYAPICDVVRESTQHASPGAVC